MKDWLELHRRNSLARRLGLLLLVVVVSAPPASGLECYRCGQYTDGPGSVTPCINYTDALHLKECPPEADRHCVKYVDEGSTVRECAAQCAEKRSDSWGTSVYCCSEDACNAAATGGPPAGARAGAVALWVVLRHRPSPFP